jgi:hypothetical protein
LLKSSSPYKWPARSRRTSCGSESIREDIFDSRLWVLMENGGGEVDPMSECYTTCIYAKEQIHGSDPIDSQWGFMAYSAARCWHWRWSQRIADQNPRCAPRQMLYN